MAYLIFQILWFLVAAAAIGFVVGWLCRSLEILRRRDRAAMQARAAQSDFEGQREQLEARLAEAVNARDALQEELAKAREATDADAKARRKLEREHSSALIRLEAREREVASLGAELEAGRGRAAEPQPLASPVAGAPLEIAPDEAEASPLTSRKR
jgi:flagellar biosynthesis/type III secretory pathway M-ring protein FliF/YscJ